MKIVSGKRMCRVLETHGWQLSRVTGSHHIYRHPTTRRNVSVPVHGNADPKPDTQRCIMRVAELTEEDL